ncbi:MAG: glutamyl-tRNA reductase [Clostridiales bacterium]|nr:glutamyl-tRNA reductase [Clostridiales bacterium]
MKLVVFSISHKNSSIELREKVAFSKSKLKRAYEILKESSYVKESVILSTCNRSEIIAVVEDKNCAENWFKKFYVDFFDLEQGELKDKYLFKSGKAAVIYLYEVCNGLDSLVLAEDQILGQVKDAHDFALEEKATGKILNKLFLGAITTAKEIKTKTNISANSLSISSIAVKQVENYFNNGLWEKTVQVIGYGEMSRLAVTHLLERNVEKIYICNRNKAAVEDLINSHDNVEHIELKHKYDIVNDVDIIISATAAPHYIYYVDEFKEKYNNKRDLCIVDIALPRDVEPGIGELDGVKLFHIDQLKDIADKNMESRMNLIEDIRKEIKFAIKEYENWYDCLPVYPKIEAIQKYSKELTDEELSKMFKKLSHLPKKDRDTIEIIVRSLVKKMWRKPILQLKNAGLKGRAEEMASFVDDFLGLE